MTVNRDGNSTEVNRQISETLIQTGSSPYHNRPSRKGTFTLIAVICLVGSLGVFAAAYPTMSWWALVPAVVAAFLIPNTVHIAFEWERVVVLRLGHFSRIAKPGLFFTIPLVEQVVLHVDQRINATPFLNEHALTSDLTPIDVDAVVFWMVWDARQVCTQVVDYPSAVSWSAQTALRDAIGHISLADVPMKRVQIDHEIQECLERKVADWGISIISVEIRDIRLPAELQNAMSKAAQAERERDARIILAEAEVEASHMFVDAANTYNSNDVALQLRTANLLYEGLKDHGGMVVIPSSFADSVGVIESLVGKLKPEG